MRPGPDTPRLRDASIRVDRIPAAGRELVLAPEAAEREELAAFLELTSIDALSVTLRALPFRGGVRVEGRLTAEIVQPSVVSLEPVHQSIDEPIDRIFLPGADKVSAATANAEVFVDLSGDEIPDRFEGGDADLSDLVIETLALAVDPYPRLEGEAPADYVEDAGDADESPFSGLKSLKEQGES
jgi:uncharacterized metal-binding protein YceD (DUF177 family)